MKLLKKGAEGDIYVILFNKKHTILKTRKKKNYRNNLLDSVIIKRRTTTESEIMSIVKSFGVSSPLIYFVDIKNGLILMQYIEGILVRDMKNRKLIYSCKEIGDIVGILHNNGIMHGDLTTSNFIYNADRIFLIDFGLSTKTNKSIDHAIDLRLFKEILNSVHTSIMKYAWKSFLSGYKIRVGYEYYDKIINLVSTVEHRGRYAKSV